MRYVLPTFIDSTLRRRKSLEQFLGGGMRDGERTIRWLELRPAATAVELWRFEVDDSNDDSYDIYGRVSEGDADCVAQAELATEVMSIARRDYGASLDRWVNVLVAGDEYADFIAAGRPQIWPMSG